MRRAPRPASRPFSAVIRILVFVATPLLSIVGACQTFALWRSLPSVQARHLDHERYSQALRDANADMSASAHQGLVAANISSLFTAALRDPTVYEKNRDTVQQMLAQLRGTQLGRLQLAAFLMLDADRNGQPPDLWWPTVQPVLAGLERASFPHFLADLIENRTHMFASLDLPPGAARLEAEDVVNFPHGPFLQSFTAHLNGAAAALRSAGDAGGAAVCDQIRRRLLREWLLEPASVSLRLLAADLLARDLETNDPAPAPAVTPDLAQTLRAWRAAYRTTASSRPAPLALFSVENSPEICPLQSTAVAHSLIRLIWSLSAAALAALIAVVALPWCLRDLRVLLPSRPLLCGLAGTLALFVTSLLLTANASPALTADLRRWTGTEAGWPRQPFIAAGIIVALIALLTLLPIRMSPTRRPLVARAAAAALGAWFALSPLLPFASFAARRALATYDSALATALSQPDPYATDAAPYATMIDRLRAWNPDATPAP